MEPIALKATVRTVQGKAVEKLRKQKLIPAVIYGAGSNQSVAVEYIPFEKAYRSCGESTLLDLAVDSATPIKVLVHEVQLEPIRGKYLHIDFYQVNMDKKLIVHIPLVFMNDARAVKELGGIFVKQIDEVEVKCLPGDLVSEIRVDISPLATFEDVLRVADIQLPKGIEILNEGNGIIASVMPPVSEAELAAMEQQQATDVSKIEVVGKAKKEEGEAVVEKAK
ncbi:MAG: 50S ribosomal protein L25 [Patescibacteria group bacterium]